MTENSILEDGRLNQIKLRKMDGDIKFRLKNMFTKVNSFSIRDKALVLLE
jgi:hypothetical protein